MIGAHQVGVCRDVSNKTSVFVQKSPSPSRGISNNKHLDLSATMSQSQTLAGKVAIVSGSESGIGFAIASELASRGAHVAINYPWEKMRQLADTKAASLPTKSIAVCADMGTVEGPKVLVETTVKAFGRLDIIVNNVAIAVNKPLEEQTLEDWDLLVNLNGRSTFLLTQQSLPHLTKGSGRIVNICSASSRGPPPLQTIYAGTKGMVDSFTKCWAKELPPKYGCTVNAVSPGPTQTEGFLAAGEEAMKVLQPTIDATPAGKRMGKPEEIAFAVAFLCEDGARWVNGAHLPVNGGLLVE
ncbi:hypothetical protein NLU13_7300 [Sarocladium strictum]|uniref:Uncharacterized protein n=1 Tax=Sarocladium strictum TaxID=5046 RepID=A0AA39GEX7_SARSR|nr:hypothetical protein NLU13_7300 [Sarocladium strictum]